MEQITDQQFRQHEAELESFAALDLTSPDAATVAKYFRPDESRNILWGIVTLDAVARDDTAREALMARVITNYARIILASKRLGVAEWKGGTGTALGQSFNVWKNDQFDVSVAWAFGASGFPLSYDLLYNDMTPEQRTTVRRAIAAATQGRRPFGSGYPKGRAFSNWFGYDGDLAVMLASIEGEEGYDAATYAAHLRVLQNYWDISFTPDGACHEDAYGPNLGCAPVRSASWCWRGAVMTSSPRKSTATSSTGSPRNSSRTPAATWSGGRPAITWRTPPRRSWRSTNCPATRWPTTSIAI